jgi:ferredoxin--NADP+ reductase
MPIDDSLKQHAVAVIGAATAGSEVARILAARGAIVVVIEQNPRPYGKIEDGLPRWHRKQRRDEYKAIDARLSHPNIEFVPLTRLGREVDFDDLIRAWGLSAVVLASGAWRDRPFPVEGADAFVGRGLVYQNSLIYWFNHYQEAGYSGPRYEIPQGALVVGGGLASIDVVKVLQIETALKALAARGIKVEMEELEREGLEPVAQAHGINWADLQVTPCRLFYRRRVLDMPLSDIPPDANPKRAEILRQARAKILDKAQRKYLFEFQDQSVPSGIVERNGRLAGLIVSRTEVTNGSVRIVPGSAQEFATAMVVSSIGSIPELLPGLPAEGEVYRYVDRKIGLLMDKPTLVFAAGNVLSGKGNIKDSLESGTEIGIRVAESYLGLSDESLPLAEVQRELAHEEALKVAEAVAQQPRLPAETIRSLRERVHRLQGAAGYEGDYRTWIAKVTPPDLE